MTNTTNPVLNSIKEKVSIAYLLGLNSTINYAIQEASKDYDGLGVDFQVTNRLVGLNRSVGSEANQINLQLKAVSISSTSMIKEEPDHIVYTLGKAIVPVGTHFLVVMVLPEESKIDTWRTCTDEELTIKRCAYYLHISERLKAGKIKIPKSNVLTPDNYKLMFELAKQKDAI